MDVDIKKTKKMKNIELCDSIDLGDFNHIQSHGVWLELDANLEISQYSDNAPALLETSLKDLLNHTILYFLKPVCSDDNIALWLTTPFNQYKAAIWSAPHQQIPILIFIHQDKGIISLEIERHIEANPYFSASVEFNEFVIAAMRKSLQSKTIDEVAKISCAEIKKLTGYQRVVIYQFDELDYTGTVIGEALDENMTSYLGLRFPATDIPASVRKMYLKFPLRYIPSILEQPVKIIARSGQGSRQIANLKNANLRMVAPVHVQYMKNMGICASSSVAIKQGNTLWGLIACHHCEPKYLSQAHRYILDIFANIVATQVLAIECTQNFHDEQKIRMIHTELTQSFRQSKSLADALVAHSRELMELISSTGMSLYLQNVLLNFGETPEEQAIIELISWLDKKDFLTRYYTNSLPLEYKLASGFKHKACGLFVIKITQFKSHYLLFYKPERINTTAWAGNPAEAIQGDEKAYSPRDSFERYLEKIENHSTPWTPRDMKSAVLIRSLLATRQLQDLLQNGQVQKVL